MRPDRAFYCGSVIRRIHIDTDFAGDPDDACALAMLLGCPDAEVVGITTSLEDDGRRNDCVRVVLDLLNRSSIPSAAGFACTLTGKQFVCTANDRHHWPESPRRNDTRPGAALDLLAASIHSGATVLAIGGFTNLAALALAHPGSLEGARIVAMAGWIEDPPPGLPCWGPSMDFNTQCDTAAATIVAGARAALSLVTVPTAMQASLRQSQMARLRSCGEIGELLANQSERHRDTSEFAALAQQHDALPNDLVNFHWDPVAAGAALDWDCITMRRTTLRATDRNGVVQFVADGNTGTGMVSVAIDGAAFEKRWLERIGNLARLARQ